jgi:hypothetical protein
MAMTFSRRQAVILIVVLCAIAALASAGRAGAPARADDVIGAIMGQANAETLAGYIRDLSGEQPVLLYGAPAVITTRYSGSAGIGLAESYLRQHYESLGLTVTHWPYGTQGWRNVVAEQRGLAHPEQIYVICAHHDSRSNDTSNDPAPGADDNGSGTAAVMLAAAILSQYDFEYTIRYVNFSGEEAGLYGSRAYAYQARLLGEQILGVINLDMISYNHRGDPILQLHAQSQASQAIANTFLGIAQQYSLPVDISLFYGNRAMGSSDHIPFWDNGFAAILGIEDYPLDFNGCYHRACDRLNLFDMDYYLAATRGALGTLATLARPAVNPPTPTPTAVPSPTPTVPCFSNYLPDGDFEDGPTDVLWQATSAQGYPLISSQLAHAGQWAAWLAQRDGASDVLCQTGALPAGARQPTIAFWWQMQTDERWHNTDWLELRARPAGAAGYTVLARLDDGAAQHLWQRAGAPLDAYVGQTLELCFVAGSDYSDRTWFFVDDVSVSYCLPPAARTWLPLTLK